MKKNFFLVALLLTTVAQGVWALDYYTPGTLSPRPTEGPWTFDDVTNQYSTVVSSSATFNSLNHSAWDQHDDKDYDDIIYQWQDGDGIGFTTLCETIEQSVFGIFSTYWHDESVPSFTRKRLTWNYTLQAYSEEFTQCVTLYAHNNLDELKNTPVDWSGYYTGYTGCPYHVTHLVTYNNDSGEKREGTSVLTKTFDFDNRNGNAAQTKSWSLLMTTIIDNQTERTWNTKNWGAFRNEGYSWASFYYKHITFLANGGSGSMAVQEIENSGNLTANTFTRANYTFAGWATTPNGDVVYANGAAITATSSDKGLVTLYAKWTPNQYTIGYELNGGSVSEANPTQYTVEDALTLNNPTREDYIFLGWTGSNGEVPQSSVSIFKGSTGNKAYTANWVSNDFIDAKEAIAAIGAVEYTAESKAKIDAARAAYDALTAAQKALVANYATLTDAEAAYDKAKEQAEGNSTINFVDENGDPVSSQKIMLDYPEAPQITGFTFLYWQAAQKDLSDGILHIQAVYKSNTPTAIDETNVNRTSSNRKLVKDGNVYILTEEYIYNMNGQIVK